MRGRSALAHSSAPGDRVKTDRRDACGLARLHRTGELTAVWVPDEGQEAMRDLTRAREDAKQAETRARQRLGSFLLRHDVRFAGRTRWSKAYFAWLTTLRFSHPMQQVAVEEYRQAVEEATARVTTDCPIGGRRRKLGVGAPCPNPSELARRVPRRGVHGHGGDWVAATV